MARVNPIHSGIDAYYFGEIFHPIPKPFISTLIKTRVPVWLLVGALAAQYVINTANQQTEPNCRIKVQRVHQSTYSLEFQNLREAKLKISTLCDVPQAYTSLTAQFEEVLSNRSNKIVKTVTNIIARPRTDRQNYVLIENLTVPCKGKGQAEYLGRAFGQVHLKDNRTVNVSGSSDKSMLLICRISAK